MSQDLTETSNKPVAAGAHGSALPAVVADAGDHAARRFLEFFAAQIRNRNTRMANYRAVCHFFGRVEQHRLSELADIEPVHVAAYIEALQETASSLRSSSAWPRSGCCSTD